MIDRLIPRYRLFLVLGFAVVAFSLFGLTVILGRVSCGYLVDRYFAPYVAVVFLVGPAVGIALLALDSGTSTVYLAAVLLGLGLGAEFDLLSYFISRYLGLKVYGKIYGLMYSAFSLGAGSGIAAYHFIATAQAASMRDPGNPTDRDSTAVHSQAFYVVGPEAPTL